MNTSEEDLRANARKWKRIADAEATNARQAERREAALRAEVGKIAASLAHYDKSPWVARLYVRLLVIATLQLPPPATPAAAVLAGEAGLTPLSEPDEQ